jgi:heptose I phosphotransferase
VIFVRPDLAPTLNDQNALRKILNLEGEVYRSVANRKTVKIELKGHSFFLKVHQGVGWKEIFKNLLLLKTPIIDSSNEWRAIQELQKIGVPTMTIAAYGMRGGNPARRQSFIMTDALMNVIDLDSFCRKVFSESLNRAKVELKWRLIRRVATITRLIHQNGINHQDLYLGHFLLNASSVDRSSIPEHIELLLSDLHRARIRRSVPGRAVVKDLAGIYFSSLDVVPLTRRDLFRFMRVYRGQRLREVLLQERSFWKKVEKRAKRLYRKIHGTDPESVVLKNWSRGTE